MNKDEQIGRLTAMCETMARQLRQIQTDLVAVEIKLGPYYRIIDDLCEEFFQMKQEVNDGDE